MPSVGSLNSRIWDRIKLPPANARELVFDVALTIVVRFAVLSLSCTIYAATLLRYATPSTNLYKLALFASIITLIPLSTALIVHNLTQRTSGSTTTLLLNSSEMLVCAAAISFAGAALLMHLLRLDIAVWSSIAQVLLLLLTGLHLIFLFVISVSSRPLGSIIILQWQKVITLGGRTTREVTLTCCVLVSLLFVFRVEPRNSMLNILLSGLSELIPRPGAFVLIAAPVAAATVILASLWLIRFESTLAIARPLALQRIQRIALVLCVLLTVLLYFDLTFRTDVLHFLTNIGPAMQAIYGGTVPMVTAYSQYGPGPLLTTWLTFMLTTPSFHAANVVSQLFSLALYASILICLYRMTRHRLAALLLGFTAIGILLSGWWGGNANLNVVPSSMGMRYLPNALLVLSISFLRDGRAVSPALFASMIMSALWSYETLAGSALIFASFILMLALRDRSLSALIQRSFVGILLPVAASTGIMSAVTLAWVGEWPRYDAYLAFLLAYSPISDFWALSGNGSFLGWVLVALTGMIVFSLAWWAALGSREPARICDIDVLLYRFAPMATLTAFMSSYFVGRSVDFTLIISFMPLIALLVPAILAVFHAAMRGWQAARILTPLACIAILLPLTFSFAAMYRAGSPYALPVQICLHERICTPSGLLKLAQARYQLRPMLDQAADPNFFEQTGITSEAIGLIKRYAADRKKIALLLGIHPATIWSIHTNIVLVLTSKGHRWPISYVLSDEVNPLLSRSILAANVQLEEGEPIFIRKDESRLGQLEGAIAEQIRRDGRLCWLAEGKLVSVYRITMKPDCEAKPPA